MKLLLTSSIAHNLLGSFLVVIIPLTLLNLGINYTSMQLVRGEVSTSYQTSLDLLARQLDNTLTNLVKLGDVLSLDTSINAIDQTPAQYYTVWRYKEVLDRLQLMTASIDLDSDVVIHLRNRDRSLSSRYGVLAGANADVPVDTSNTVGWNWRRRASNNANVLSFVQTQLTDGSRENVTISINIEEAQIKSLLSNLQVYGGNAFLLDGSQQITLPDSRYQIDGEALKNALTTTGLASGQFSYEQAGQRYRVLFKQSPQTQLTIGLYFTEEQYLTPIRRFNSLILVVLAVSVVLSVLFVVIAYRRLLLPIHKLIRAMQQVRDGDLKVRIAEHQREELGFMFTQFNHMVSRIDSLVNEIYLERIHHQQSQLKLLQSQINPHFLYNCLNFIYQMSMGSDNNGAANMSLYLAKYFRFATRANTDMITLRDELENISAYVHIQQMRYPNKIQYHVSVPESLASVSIPRLTLQPLVENAIIHGIEEVARSGIIWVCAVIESSAVVIRVENDGKQISNATIAELHQLMNQHSSAGTDHGLVNTYRRLKLSLGEHADLRIRQKQPNGTQVIVVIPLPVPAPSAQKEMARCTAS